MHDNPIFTCKITEETDDIGDHAVIAHCNEVDVIAYGDTEDEARVALAHTIAGQAWLDIVSGPGGEESVK